MPKPSLLLLAVCLSVPAVHAAELVPKQLAGPPGEFAQMRAPDPAQAAVMSKSALLPVELAPQAGGAGWQGTLPAENGRLRFLVLPGEGAWDAAVAAPGLAATAATAPVRLQPQAASLGSGQALAQGQRYEIDAAPGEWTLTLRSATPQAQRGYVLLEGDAATRLAAYPRQRRQQLGQPQVLNAMLAGTDAAGASALGRAAGRIERAQLRVIAPDGRITTAAMADDGRHDDGSDGDGVFGGSFVPDASGTWIAQVVVHGRDPAGAAFVRTSEHVLPVLDATLELASGTVGAEAADGTRLSLPLRIAARGADAPSHYRVIAELWGTAADGAEVPVAWVGGMVAPVQGRLPLGLDERWIARAGARAPFTLRRLRIEDPDHFIPLAEAATVPLALPALRRSTLARTDLARIDDEMRMGPRPAALMRAATDAQAQATGSQLLLVHGYCSGGVWPQAQFSNASSFLDTNQNRSNDQFAQRLAQFGSQWNSFGTVAHSQGGMAALHLYSYYWSGLDNASGSRLLQSVGTPYQGTNLAGILATVGSWFGIACGSNSDMTYSGAQAWLAGIPASARAKVNYYTTSFAKTNWYTNDYCNAASDLVLDDPEDGTVEQVEAQLPGGINRGHTTGQCHTTGMRDPAQYLDSSRNATMNANAAR
ncbi:choice-of-anchor X domain-containing protein [Stenotrophomonas sp. MMGLT7]|uniref:choice-of-anchor X domain-containing protein n=1 Tax=Stenotrophomonas sp. MMGLT7 TaxID=2901227 RepID=UPI001E55FC03|nr:choice-of-anchor X domain-containing protein [Stenotrophomonas sp. MMGLT7]MCD7098051.1 conditioned medium factor [Stenotrophomonas sp. MMGLT7]